MPAIGIALGVEERARRRSVIAQDRGRRAPGGPAGRVDPGQERRPDRAGRNRKNTELMPTVWLWSAETSSTDGMEHQPSRSATCVGLAFSLLMTLLAICPVTDPLDNYPLPVAFVGR